jgi:hypothetical protein
MAGGWLRLFAERPMPRGLTTLVLVRSDMVEHSFT